MIDIKSMPIFKEDVLKFIEYVEKNPYEIENISKKRRMLLKKYSFYYDTTKAKLRQQQFIIYVEEMLESDKEVKNLKTTINKIIEVVRIFRSNKTEEEKIQEIKQIYINSTELLNTYIEFIIPLANNSIINELHQIYMAMKKYDNNIIKSKEIEKSQNLIEYFNNRRMFFENYNYSRYIVTEYINDDSAYMIDEFLDRYGINRKIFDKCVRVLEELDVDLYNRYIFKEKDNITRKYMEYREIFEDIIHGIKTNKLNDGTDFDIIEFWKRVPFINSKIATYEFADFKKIDSNLDSKSQGFKHKVKSFVEITQPKETELIKEFLIKHKIGTGIIKLDLINLNSNPYKIADISLTVNEINKIVNYMISNDIPLIRNAYIAVVEKYLNNGINIEDIKNAEKTKMLKKTLIP